jgi:heme/copper-type cytochrome/quinol oxidase subunit 2
MKNKLLVLILVIFTSCNTTKQFDKISKKYGIKESVARLELLHPEQFNPTFIYDTIDSISGTINCDSIMNILKDGTIVTLSENKNLKLQLESINHRLKIKSTIKPDTIKVPVNVPVEVRVPCPDVNILGNKIKEQDLKFIKYKNKTTLTIVIESFLLLLCVLIFIFKFLKK